MTITQTVEIPADRWLRIRVPNEIPEGKTDVIIQFPAQETTEKPKMQIPKDNNGKIRLTRKELDEMLKDCPITQRLSGILSSAGTVDLDEIRMARLSKHL